MEEEITIVIIAYNRPNSLKRLLESLKEIKSNEKIRLYISIDRAKNEDLDNNTFRVAKDFKWKFGEKIVDFKKENLGLRQHVLQCGNLTSEYNNIIMLEDDIVVSPLMYVYAKQVLQYYKNEEKIAGFGLYKFERNQYVNEPFYPISDGTDVFFAQVACSWGQMWTAEQWKKFYNWYIKNENVNFAETNMPTNIKRWSEKSWLKYFMKYLVEQNKYFVYPQISMTTNFTDVGTHNKKSDISYQTVLAVNNNNNININFRFEKIDESNCLYDAFFENQCMGEITKYGENIECDFYGTKDINKINSKLLLSSKVYNYEIIHKFDIVMYPYEQNIINKIKGKDLFLYDLSKKITQVEKADYQRHIRYIYRIGNMDGKILKAYEKIALNEIKEKIKNRLKKTNKRK